MEDYERQDSWDQTNHIADIQEGIRDGLREMAKWMMMAAIAMGAGAVGFLIIILWIIF